MTTPYIKDLFNLYKKIIDETDKNNKELFIINFIGKNYENKNDIANLIKEDKKKDIELEDDKIKIDDKFIIDDKNLKELDKLFNYKYENKDINNILYNFALLIIKIGKFIKGTDNFIKNDEISLNEFDKKIDKEFIKTNKFIVKKANEIENSNLKFGKKMLKKVNSSIPDLTKLEIFQILNGNKEDFEVEINDFKKNINDLINEYNIKYENLLKEITTNDNTNYIKDIEINDKIIKDFLNNNYNNFFKKFKKNLNEKLNKKENENIKILFDFFIDKGGFKFPDLKDVIEDLTEKYKFFNEKKDDIKDITFLLDFEELFDTNNGDWIKDSKKDKKIKEYKDKYDEILLKLKPEKVEVKKDFTDLYNYSEKIKEIKEKLDKKEKLQKSERDFIINFEEYMNVIKNNPQFASDPDFNKQVKNIEDLYKTFNIKENVEREIEAKRIVENVISKEEKERNIENVYFEDYIQFFKIALKLFAYCGILFAFIVLFLSILGLIILIYDMIFNTIKLFVNSANSTNNLSIDYISKSIIRCNKDNYDNDRFFILTEQKQNLTIFNLGAYTLYLLIIYFIVYFSLVFYSNQMKFTFIGSMYDIDINFIYLFMIGLLIFYSFIHLILFKSIFKPFVYIPYKTIDEEEKNIDKLIASYIIVKSEKNTIIKFNDFFDLLYDASKLEELNEYILKQIKSEDSEGCLEQKIIIYNLYEYLRQYVIFDEDFKLNFKQYCSTDENSKPKYENGDTITFISMLKNNEVNIISNYHEDLEFIKNLPDKNIEFYNKLNTQISDKIKNINKKIITHNKTTLPFFITIIYIILIFLLNFIAVYFIIQMILSDKTDAYHKYIIYASTFLNDYVYKLIKKIFNK